MEQKEMDSDTSKYFCTLVNNLFVLTLKCREKITIRNQLKSYQKKKDEKIKQVKVIIHFISKK